MKQLFTRMNKYTTAPEVAAFAKAARTICEENGWMGRNTYPYSYPVRASEIIEQLESFEECTSGTKLYLMQLANGFMDVLEMWAARSARKEA